MAQFQIGDKVKFLNSVGGGVVTKIDGNGYVFVRDDTGFDMPMPPNELIRMADMSGAGKVFNQEVGGTMPPAETSRTEAEPPRRDKQRENALNRRLQEKFGTTADDDSDKLREENKRLRAQLGNLQNEVKKLRTRLQQIQNQNARQLSDNILLQYIVRPGEAEVDLHIEALHERPEQLSDSEKHEIQLRYFRTCLTHAMLNGFKRVVFIHGVGRGVLKSDIQRELGLYENITYIDAPAAVYGAGATDVYFK